MKSNNPLSRTENLVVQETGDEIMIYDLATNKAFCLNETSALVWELCDGNKSISEISKTLGEKLKSSSSEDLVWLAIEQLKKDNLIANGEELENKFEGISRRDVIKKVGLGTMIALPMVSGLIAPKAVNAQSGLVCTQGGTGAGATFRRGQDSYCRCQTVGSVQGTFCTPDESQNEICKTGCRCQSAATGSPNGTCQ